MDRLKNYRQAIRDILTEYARIPYAHDELKVETVFDGDTDRYVVVVLGREAGRRLHHCLIHIEILDGKIWIQADGTEDGVANALVAAGVPKSDIVLGFKSSKLRKFTDFAPA
jgi:hypothetical protein